MKPYTLPEIIFLVKRSKKRTELDFIIELICDVVDYYTDSEYEEILRVSKCKAREVKIK